MKRVLTYFIFYSVGGFVLERIINLIFMGEWYDNSVLIGPYQGLYGVPVVIGILLYEFLISRIDKNVIRTVVLVIVSIGLTYLSEKITGEVYEIMTGVRLWNYSLLPVCKGIYTCYFATTLFGVLSFFVIRYFHPVVKKRLDDIKWYLIYPVMVLYFIDVYVTFTSLI